MSSRDPKHKMSKLARTGVEYTRVVQHRINLEPKEPALTWQDFLGGNKPICTEPDCDGIMLPSGARSWESTHAYCLLCGRRQKMTPTETPWQS